MPHSSKNRPMPGRGSAFLDGLADLPDTSRVAFGATGGFDHLVFLARHPAHTLFEVAGENGADGYIGLFPSAHWTGFCDVSDCFTPVLDGEIIIFANGFSQLAKAALHIFHAQLELLTDG